MNQLRSFGRRALCAGSVASHRVAGCCVDVVKSLAGNQEKLGRARVSLDEAFTVLELMADSNAASVHADVRDASIYVVDDDADNCDCIAMSLDKLGLRTHYASKASLATDYLEATRADLIVLDVDLGEANGFDLHEQIRRLPHHKATPVLFLSALSSAEAEVVMLNRGKDAFLAKPYTLSILGLRVISMMLRARAAAAAR
jgi:PleD family two-component response regulator